MNSTTIRKKQYAAPKVKDLGVEETKFFLLNQANHGDGEAEEMLRLLKQNFA